MIIYSDEKQIFNNVKNEWYDTKKIPCFKYCSKIYAKKEEILSLLKEVANINADNIAFDDVTVKITNQNKNTDYEEIYISFEQIRDVVKDNPEMLKWLDISEEEMQRKTNHIVNQDENYYRIENWKKDVAYGVIKNMEALECGTINSILSSTYNRMRISGFDMEKAQDEFTEKYNSKIDVSGINAIADNKEYREHFMTCLKEVFAHEEKNIERRIITMQERLDTIRKIFNGETNFSDNKN